MAWWQHGAIYQIYPRSFADSNGDGVGDLRGIAAHLDHLSDLAVEAIWLSPFFTSPMADFGYDVSDYRDVDPIFGTLADFDDLVAACHERGIRVVIDWVPNHTSDRHAWFKASRSSRYDPKRDWYVWRDGDGPPGLPDAEIPPDRVVDVDGRDPQRAPMPWAPAPGAGFTEGEPWLPVEDALNAHEQAGDPRSSLTLFRRLAALRRELPALQSGSQRMLEAGEDVLAWIRGEEILAAVNFGPARWPLSRGGRILVSSDPDRAEGPAAEIVVRPHEAVLVALEEPGDRRD